MNANADTEKNFNYFFGLLNLAAVFCIVWFLWYIFMNPDTVMKLYTPMYGFSLVVVFLSSIILMTSVVEYSAFIEKIPAAENIIWRGIIMTIVAFILMLLLVYVVFWGFIGKFGIAYFSPDSIVAGGGIGAEPWAARENASIAILYFFTAFLWIALFWNVGCGRWPWQKSSSGVIAWSRVFAIFFFTSIVYTLLFHPHVCYLFYPAQTKAGVASWWAEFAGTGSAFFGLGLVLCTLYWIIISDMLWEGYPWKWFEKDGEGTFVKALITFIVTFVLGMIMVFILIKIMNVVWDEAFVGGQYTDGPDFRYLHAGEIGAFFILAAFILKNYFNNFPNAGPLWLKAIIRTVIAMAIGMLIYWFYYSPLAVFFLARVEGFAQPDDKSLVWVLLFLSIIMIQWEFFEGWPLKKVRTKEDNG
jgi:AAT family amino acid transporter